jgi:hypothetical protein
MMPTSKFPTYLKLIIIFLLGTIVILFPISLPPGIGDGDFQAYWSSAYLFSRGRDFSDVDALGETERSFTNWSKPETLYAWFSPIGNVVLLPFTAVSFSRAVYYWLLFNITALFVSAILICDRTNSYTWVPILAVFSFSMTIVSLVYGQTNILEVLGLALFISFSKVYKYYLAGAGLVLTIIKPHLVILTLPILLLDLIRKRQWKTITGFAVMLAGVLALLFAYYPPWIQSFWSIVTSGLSTTRETPTIIGIFVSLGLYRFGKWTWVVVLVSAIIWWWKRGHTWNRRVFIDISITVGLIVSPLGWSYDQVMLIFPILSILCWITKGELSRFASIAIITLLVVMNLISYRQRMYVLSEVWFFWIPAVVLCLYLTTQRLRKSKQNQNGLRQ